MSGKQSPTPRKSRFIQNILTGLMTAMIIGSTVTFLLYHKHTSKIDAEEADGESDFLEDYLSTSVDVFKNQNHHAPRTTFKIASSNVEEEFESYLLKKQEYKMSTYLLALTNSVKVVHLPYTETHLDAIRDCSKYMKPSLFYNQHSLELRFPYMLSQMSQLNEKYKGKRGTSNFDIQYQENRTLPLNPLIRNEYVYDEPLFYYMQSFVYYIVYCSYKPRGKENWLKGTEYLKEISDHIVGTPEWQENLGINFISPASHPKSGPSVVHPANINAFSRQTFLRTDFDFSGYTPKDIIVPYYVEYTYNRQMYINSSVRVPDAILASHIDESGGLSARNSSSGGKTGSSKAAAEDAEKRRKLGLMSSIGAGEDVNYDGSGINSGDAKIEELADSTQPKDLLLFFVGHNNPPGGLRQQFQEKMAETIKKNSYQDIAFYTEPTTLYNYKSMMFNAEFCLNVRGDTASSGRLFTSIEAGCIPVIISDWIKLPFESIIDYSQFSLVFPESIMNNVDYLIDYLRLVSPKRKQKMRQALYDVRPMLLYEPSLTNYYILNPVTLSLVEAFINRKQYCDHLTSPESNPMCKRLLKRLQVAHLHTFSKSDYRRN